MTTGPFGHSENSKPNCKHSIPNTTRKDTQLNSLSSSPEFLDLLGTGAHRKEGDQSKSLSFTARKVRKKDVYRALGKLLGASPDNIQQGIVSLSSEGYDNLKAVVKVFANSKVVFWGKLVIRNLQGPPGAVLLLLFFIIILGWELASHTCHFPSFGTLTQRLKDFHPLERPTF